MTDLHITIRPATASDAPSISALARDVFSRTFGHSVTPAQLARYLDEAFSVSAVTTDADSPDKDLFVSTRQGVGEEVTGFALVNRTSSDECVAHLPQAVELQRLYVRADCQGTGVGGALADFVDGWARERGYEWIWLGVWEENARAQSLYARLGYERVGEHVFDFGGDLQTDWILVKRL